MPLQSTLAMFAEMQLVQWLPVLKEQLLEFINLLMPLPLLVSMALLLLLLLPPRKERNVKLNPKLRLKLILGYCILATMDILDIMVMDMDLDTDGADIMDWDIMEDAATTKVLLFHVLENRSFFTEIKIFFIKKKK